MLLYKSLRSSFLFYKKTRKDDAGRELKKRMVSRVRVQFLQHCVFTLGFNSAR